MSPKTKTAVLGALVAVGVGAFLLVSLGEHEPERLLANVLSSGGSIVFDRDTPPEPIMIEPQTVHLATPEPMYAIYMTQCAVGTRSLRDSLVKLIDSTKLNAVVIDIKDYSGSIAFKPEAEILQPAWAAANCGARDMKEFIETLHEKGIYVIGRITVFQDPFYTKNHPEQSVQSKARPGEPWKDHKGLSFVAVNSEPFWEYIVELSKESYALGFDELNYDYVRWPSDGPMSDIVYPPNDRAEELEKFFRYLHEKVKPIGAVMSADLFGYTTVLTDDLGIGQVLERVLPYFDYIAPMVYPSHYNKGFAGLANPNSDPYKVVYTSMVEAARRAKATETPIAFLGAEPVMREEAIPAHTLDTGEFIATTTRHVPTGMYKKQSHSPLKLRPWLQDFDYGKDYLPADVDAQIRATEDAGLTSWFFWDPSNRYDSLRQVLQKMENANIKDQNDN